MKKIYNLFLSILLLSVFSCGGEDREPESMAPIPAPEAASLIFPENNTECNISEILSDTQSIVPFQWNASENTDTYELTIRNLNTNLIATTVIVGIPEAGITLERGTPYEWSVVSIANNTNETATSTLFRFFNEGPGIENYAPFPASAINPLRGANLESSTIAVSLEWNGSDIDDDIASYEVLFGTDANPSTSIGTTTDSFIADVPISLSTTYYWRVITLDSQQNSSTSEVFEFRVQ